MVKLRGWNIAVVLIAVTLSTAAFFLTYTVAMTPYDQPNVVIAPFIPGFFVYQLLRGFREGPIPNGISGIFIAAINAFFYGVMVFALYRIFRKYKSHRSRP